MRRLTWPPASAGVTRGKGPGVQTKPIWSSPAGVRGPVAPNKPNFGRPCRGHEAHSSETKPIFTTMPIRRSAFPGAECAQTKPKGSGQSSVDGGQSYKQTQFPAWQQRAECAKQNACVKNPRAGLRPAFLGQYRRSVWPIPTLGGRVQTKPICASRPGEMERCVVRTLRPGAFPGRVLQTKPIRRAAAGDAVGPQDRLCKTNPISGGWAWTAYTGRACPERSERDARATMPLRAHYKHMLSVNVWFWDTSLPTGRSVGIVLPTHRMSMRGAQRRGNLRLGWDERLLPFARKDLRGTLMSFAVV